ncbi:MAG: hypothetical protein OXC30_03100 [Alphaproteobacteria bacterium]|nr:hypothetical protein [Alphaproteobacteria bacterium]
MKNIIIIFAMIVLQAKSAEQHFALRGHDTASHMLSDGNDKDRYKDHLHSLAQMYEEMLSFGVIMAEGLYFLNEKLSAPSAYYSDLEWAAAYKEARAMLYGFHKLLTQSYTKFWEVLNLETRWVVYPETAESNRMRSAKQFRKDALVFADNVEGAFERLQQICQHYQYFEENQKKKIQVLQRLLTDENDEFFHTVRHNINDYCLFSDYRLIHITKLAKILADLKFRFFESERLLEKKAEKQH